jgi:hypothetical protein
MQTILYIFLEHVWGFRTERTHKEITTRFWNNDSEDAGGRREACMFSLFAFWKMDRSTHTGLPRRFWK